MFLQKSKRGNSAKSNKSIPKPKEQPKGVIQYDIESNTIQAELRKKLETGNNPLLLKMPLKAKTGFNTNVPRWQNIIPDEGD